MKQRFRRLLCWIRRKHKPSIHLRESDQRVMIWVCDNCGLLLHAKKLNKKEQRECRKMRRKIGYQPPLIRA